MGNWERKNCEWAAKQKGKMVQNAGNVLKFGVKIKGARMKIAAICMQIGL